MNGSQPSTTPFSNPKRSFDTTRGKASWFNYYAGFSTSFVRDVISQASEVYHQPRIIDPWNGSGTTTATAQDMGLSSAGFDINPVMVAVAKSKLIQIANVKQSLQPLAIDLVCHAERKSKIEESDPLLEWMRPASAKAIRALTEAIRNVLVSPSKRTSLMADIEAGQLSDLAAFFTVAVFSSTRTFLSRYYSSNPTWIKSPQSWRHRASPSPEHIFQQFLSAVETMSGNIVANDASVQNPVWKASRVELGDSGHLPVEENCFDMAITSPPYCTRIDYAVATRPELAVLGCDAEDGFDKLRRKMLGSPTVPDQIPVPDTSWGNGCREFLDAVKGHASKASKTYYFKVIAEYYRQMSISLKELHRVVKPTGASVFVVQDSYYKDVHNDVPLYVTEMAEHLGWNLHRRQDYSTAISMGQINSRSRKYRKNHRVNEAVLWFTKPKGAVNDSN